MRDVILNIQRVDLSVIAEYLPDLVRVNLRAGLIICGLLRFQTAEQVLLNCLTFQDGRIDDLFHPFRFYPAVI